MIASIQHFKLHSQAQGGSARIIRSLFAADHPPLLNIDTYFPPEPGPSSAEDLQLPLRPAMGRLEFTRLHTMLAWLDGVYGPRFERRLYRLLTERRIRLVHHLANGYTILPVYHVTARLGLPLFLTVHDDLEYVAAGHPLMDRMQIALAMAWRAANTVYVISEELGKEYESRYGTRKYQIVTDGLTLVTEKPLERPDHSIRLYFMGLFHQNYAPNFRAVLDALQIVRRRRPDWVVTVTCRCGSIPVAIEQDDVPVSVLPFAPAEELDRDMQTADVLYQPMPFQENAQAFSRFSLSTKMITYLGSGLPILYHGPEDAAACQLLERHQAAAISNTLDPEAIAGQLIDATTHRDAIVRNALALARSRFLLEDQQKRFWEPIVAAL